MEAILALALLVAGAWFIAQSVNRRENAQVLASQELKYGLYIEDIRSTSEAAAQQHIRVLWTKWKQLRYPDDYGHISEHDWQRELRYFVETVVAPQLNLNPDTEEADKDYAARVVGYEVIEYDIEIDGAFDEEVGTYDPQMSGVEFEQLIERALLSAGAEVRRTSVTGDQGVDLLADHDGVTIAIQCKRCASSVGNKAVQEVSAGRAFYGADRAWVVSDASFTKAARQLASSLDVDLVHYLGVPQRLRGVAPSAATTATEDRAWLRSLD